MLRQTAPPGLYKIDRFPKSVIVFSNFSHQGRKRQLIDCFMAIGPGARCGPKVDFGLWHYRIGNADRGNEVASAPNVNRIEITSEQL
jgi:hypothetical protein